MTAQPVQQTTPFSFENSTTVAPVINQPQPAQQSFVPTTQAPVQSAVVPPTIPQQPFNAFSQPREPFVQQPQPQVYGQPNYGTPQYPNQFGVYGQQQNFGYPQNPQQQFVGVPNQGFPQQAGYNPYANPVYQNTPQVPVSQPQKNANLNMGITLNAKK